MHTYSLHRNIEHTPVHAFFILILKMYFSPPEPKEAGADNRNIIDDGKSQKLTRDDIEALKEKGIKGQVGSICCINIHRTLGLFFFTLSFILLTATLSIM